MKRIYKKGDIVRLIKNNGMAAEVRETAVVTDENKDYLWVTWLPTKYKKTQNNGNYPKGRFVLDKIVNWKERIR